MMTDTEVAVDRKEVAATSMDTAATTAPSLFCLATTL